MSPLESPLTGTTVIDVSTMGPGPFASMVLADFGADVIQIRRPGSSEVDATDQFMRGKRQLIVDLRAPGGAELIARLADAADVFLESYRPGTMERRGLGPDLLLARNPRLVYTRLTGWGQSGPYATTAGHDINYAAIGGPLGAVGDDPAAAPVPALNLFADFSGGSFPAVLGTVLALLARTHTGRGQVVDASMVDGANYLMFAQFQELGLKAWQGRGTSLLSGIAPFYGVYRCADGTWMSVGAIETKFYAELITLLGLDPSFVGRQHERADWPAARAEIAAAFATQPRDHWLTLFTGTDACVYPVLDLDEIPTDPHVAARGSVTIDERGQYTVAPAPVLSETPGQARPTATTTGTTERDTLTRLGITSDDIAHFQSTGALHLTLDD